MLPRKAAFQCAASEIYVILARTPATLACTGSLLGSLTEKMRRGMFRLSIAMTSFKMNVSESRGHPLTRYAIGRS
jgi:hypothetical protein